MINTYKHKRAQASKSTLIFLKNAKIQFMQVSPSSYFEQGLQNKGKIKKPRK